MEKKRRLCGSEMTVKKQMNQEKNRRGASPPGRPPAGNQRPPQRRDGRLPRSPEETRRLAGMRDTPKVVPRDPPPKRKVQKKQKYSAEQRRRRRKRRMVFFYTFIFFLVIGTVVALSLTVFFKIETIRVTGSSRYSAQDIVAACGIQKGENLFLANTRNGEATIERTLPYIGKVHVSRSFPSVIVVNVEEAAPFSTVEYGGGYAVLDQNGKVLEISSAPAQNCPVVKGLALSLAEPGKEVEYSDAKVQEAYEELVKEIESVKIEKVTEINLTDMYNIRIVCDTRLTYLLGTQAELNKKLRFGLQVQGQLESENSGCSGQIDLSLVPETDKAYFKDLSGESSSAAAASSGGESQSP